jgi:hypothetical protein
MKPAWVQAGRPPGKTKFDQNVKESGTGTSRCTLTTFGADQLFENLQKLTAP